MIQLKPTAYLGIALALSLSTNAFLIYHAGANSAKAQHEIELAREKGKAEVLQDAVDTNQAIADAAAADYLGLLEQLNEIAERGQKTRIIYREIAADEPLAAGCGPGQRRMDAVNESLGGNRE